MPLTTNTLNSLLALLKEEGSHVLASLEDANFFRNLEKTKSRPTPAPPPLIIPAESPPVKEIKKEPPPQIAPQIKPPVAVKKPPLEKPIVDFTRIRNVLSVAVPELAILEEIPDDTIAKKISERWKTKNQTAPISIVVYQEPPEQRALLEQIALAIDLHFGPAKIVDGEKIEQEKQWDTFLSVQDLKLVIVCDYTLWQLNSLMQFYKETPAQGTRVLKDKPIFLLPDLSLYLKDSLLKRSLWKALCQKLS